MSEKKEENKEPIRPILVLPWIDKAGHAVIKTTTKKDAETLNVALDNHPGILVKGPEEGKTCPIEPGTPYEKSVCKVIDELFKKRKKRMEKKKRKEKTCKTCM